MNILRTRLARESWLVTKYFEIENSFNELKIVLGEPGEPGDN